MARPEGAADLETRSREALGPNDEGREVRLERERPCPSCGHFIDVAKVVKLSDHEYDYLCLGCAVRFRRTGRLKIQEAPDQEEGEGAA